MNSLNTNNFTYNMTELLQVTRALQEVFKCKNCNQEYSKKWCKDDGASCFYCTNFLPMRDTYASILKNIDWYYLKSGEISRPEYYNSFLDNLQKWSQRFYVLPTKQDKRDEEELRRVQDWTRDYKY